MNDQVVIVFGNWETNLHGGCGSGKGPWRSRAGNKVVPFPRHIVDYRRSRGDNFVLSFSVFFSFFKNKI